MREQRGQPLTVPSSAPYACYLISGFPSIVWHNLLLRIPGQELEGTGQPQKGHFSGPIMDSGHQAYEYLGTFAMAITDVKTLGCLLA